MITTITLQDLTPMEGFQRFCTEASDIRLGVGIWPIAIPVESSLGNGQPLIRHRALRHNGEFAGAVYKQQFGSLEVHVLND